MVKMLSKSSSNEGQKTLTDQRCAFHSASLGRPRFWEKSDPKRSKYQQENPGHQNILIERLPRRHGMLILQVLESGTTSRFQNPKWQKIASNMGYSYKENLRHDGIPLTLQGFGPNSCNSSTRWQLVSNMEKSTDEILTTRREFDSAGFGSGKFGAFIWWETEHFKRQQTA